MMTDDARADTVPDMATPVTPTTARRLLSTLMGIVRRPDNLALYRSPDVVRHWSTNRDLQPAEAKILERIGHWLAGRTMLDVGVGNGRTTWHFAPLVASYVGVDYSAPMVSDCVRRVGGEFANASYRPADVRDLRMFEDHSFDFVLFSFNGLDCVDHVGRMTALKEVRRVCRPDGMFVFSSHNLSALGNLFRLRPDERATAMRRVRGIANQLLLRMLNQPLRRLQDAPYALVRETYFGYRSEVYYVRPAEQLAQLTHTGFDVLDAYGALSGEKIDLSAIDRAHDSWIYYLAQPSATEPVDRQSD